MSLVAMESESRQGAEMESGHYTHLLLLHVTPVSLALPQHVGLRCPILQRRG